MTEAMTEEEQFDLVADECVRRGIAIAELAASWEEKFHKVAEECVRQVLTRGLLEQKIERLERELEHERALCRAAALELAKRTEL